MQCVEQITGPGIAVLMDDIDTDRIIPARFLRCVTFDGIGEHAFEDDRQQDPSHPFNDARYRQAKVLVSGRNFGCGSSREHAPQSLMRWGIQTVIAESFAEIFFGNCIAIGVAPIIASRPDLEKLTKAIEQDPNLQLHVDLKTLKIRFGKEEITGIMPKSAQDALVTGQWDFLGQLLANKPAIEKKMHDLPYLSGYANV
ncbi:3-isopropylmalate dehydratase small subunit [Planctomicrobium piriforme]|uniref:3-isopropylmalate dehydratase n=1 Tax=Planctomicrobium piriforme TaxID=1576369 RepID=A0A1I3B9Q4_9PLAN|nr:3-isopropylmalate dehydratase small subunit [Planctomicrobium piriforme]SFH58982.1 3-isopropylmalate/(R)-2-methylmalate dehydratase small subunit [Planctomicrobium piriforme]